jgi:pimeloyl-ACP methyl ester carboxylesterase
MQVAFNNGEIHYKTEGQGPAIVCLHGFMESARIWRPFVEKLSTKFKVIRINLPGHGKSSVFGETHTMEFMAECVKAVLEQEKIEKALIVGHSMGGYVGLSLAEMFPHLIKGLILFSSTCFEDTPERKEDRNRAAKAADAHKMKFITSVVPNLFFERTGAKASKRIFKLVKIAAKQPKEGIIAAIKGMQLRTDKTHVLSKAKFPILFLTGHDDLLIPLERVQEMAKHAPTAQTVVIEQCGHVGFLEHEKESIKAIQTFALQKIL